jgi:hypothetical protein
MKFTPAPAVASLFISCVMVGCLPYKFNTVDFAVVSSISTNAGTEPKTDIDTNTDITGPFGGFVTSRKPY